MEVLGFVFCGEKIRQGSYYKRRSKKGYQYYRQYDTRAGTNRSTEKKTFKSK